MNRLSSLFRRHSQPAIAEASQNNALPPSGSRLTRILAFIAACGLVFSSAAFGAIYAWQTGQAIGAVFAGVMVAAAIAVELAKPLALASALTAWRRLAVVRASLLTLLALACIGYSLVSSLSLVASSRSDVAAKREAVIESHGDRRKAIDAARTELATLAPARTQAEVQADVTKLLASNPKAGDCRNPTTNAIARTVCPRVATLHGEAARATRRAELQAIIAKHTTDGVTPAVAVGRADAGASSLATYLAALGVNVPARLLSDWLVLIPVLALELGAALALVLVQAVGGHQSAQKTAPTVEPKVSGCAEPRPAQPQTPLVDTKPRRKPDDKPRKPPRKPRPSAGGNRTRKARRRLGNVINLVRREGGHLQASARSLARTLKVSKSRANELLHEAAAAGLLKIQATKRGTSLALAS
jgi:hypothetical protein